jgi:hypothetical protein
MPKSSGRKTIKTDQRVFTAGKTGSGKTYLWRHLLKDVQRLVVLDGKGTLGDWGLTDWQDREGRRNLFKGEPVRLRVLAPLGERDPSEYWDQVLWDCYEAGNVLIYCDELYAVNPPQKPALSGLHAVYTRGRELQVGMISVTQRPTWIPLVVMSEADWFFCFRLQLQEDRARVAAFMGPDVLTPPPDKWGFYYMESEDDRPKYVKRYTAGSFKI